MGFMPVMLWTDALVYLLLAAAVAFAAYVRRHEHLLGRIDGDLVRTRLAGGADDPLGALLLRGIQCGSNEGGIFQAPPRAVRFVHFVRDKILSSFVQRSRRLFRSLPGQDELLDNQRNVQVVVGGPGKIGSQLS